MGFVYARGNKITVKFRNAAGKWVAKATGIPVGQEKKAQALLRKIEVKIAAGKDVFGSTGLPATVRDYGDRWLTRRRLVKKNSAKNDEGRLKAHVYPAIGNIPLAELRARHCRHLLDTLKTTKSRLGGFLAPRSIVNVISTLHSMLEDAVVDELIEHNPCVFKRGELPTKADKDPDFRRNAVFTADEVLLLTGDDRIPHDRRVANAIMFLGGTRFGEMAALRWSAYDDKLQPLGKLYVTKSYNTRLKEEKATKTERVREVPVHPVLAAILEDWRKTRWAAMLGREPKMDDLIVPSREGKNRSVNHGLKRFHEDCDRVGIRNRRQHDARRTFVSLARGGGAAKDVLRNVTHGAAGDVMDMYTTLAWPVLCEAVLCFKLPGKAEPKGLLAHLVPQAFACPEVEVEALAPVTLVTELVTGPWEEAAEQEKGPQPWEVASLAKWRGVRDSNPWPPA